MAANYRQTIVLNASMDQTLNVLRSREFCSELNVELKSENKTQSGVWFRFHHGMTMTSWGEKITVTLTPTSYVQTNVEAFSECGMPTQIVDWGKNKQNVCNILEYIEKAVSSAEAYNAEQPSAEAYSAEQTIQNAPGKKYCIKCGKQIDDDSFFCCYCGQKQS